MRRRALYCLSAFILCSFSTSALATDLEVPRFGQPPGIGIGQFRPNVFTWTGFYAGLGGGAAFGEAAYGFERQKIKKKHKKKIISGEAEFDSDGFTVTGIVGYNYQFGNVVVGAEGELGYLGIDKEQAVGKDDFLRQSTGLFGSVRARIGYAFNRLLIYGTGGAAFINIQNSGGTGAHFQTFEETRPGFVVGAGLEYAFTQNVIGRLEYLYLDTPEYEVRNLANEMKRFDNNFHIVRVAATYKF